MSQPPELPPRRGHTRRGELPEPPSITVNRIGADEDEPIRGPIHLDYVHGERDHSGCRVFLIAILGVVAVVALFASDVRGIPSFVSDLINQTRRATDAQPALDTAVNTDGSPTQPVTTNTDDTVVLRLQNIAQMVTVQQTYDERFERLGGTADPETALAERIVDGFGLDTREFAREPIVIAIYMDVSAGVDMRKLRTEDVVISADGSAIMVTLPASEIFTATINDQRSFVEQRTTKTITRPITPLTGDVAMETMALPLRTACNLAIMQTAAENAKTQTQRILSFAGFSQIDVLAPVGECTLSASTE